MYYSIYAVRATVLLSCDIPLVNRCWDPIFHLGRDSPEPGLESRIGELQDQAPSDRIQEGDEKLFVTLLEQATSNMIGFGCVPTGLAPQALSACA